MSKGMSIEDFRKSLESDATKELDGLKALTESQKSKIKELSESRDHWLNTVNEQAKLIDQLCNRCYALTNMGALCMYCGIKNECKNSPANQFIERWRKEGR